MPRIRVLVVEDGNIITRDLLFCLKSLGYVVSAVASSGEEAVKKAEKIHPDVILMDIALKGDMDGIEASEKIYNRFNIPVVYLTAFSKRGVLERVKTNHSRYIIVKPFDVWELQNSIEQALGR